MNVWFIVGNVNQILIPTIQRLNGPEQWTVLWGKALRTPRGAQFPLVHINKKGSHHHNPSLQQHCCHHCLCSVAVVSTQEDTFNLSQGSCCCSNLNPWREWAKLWILLPICVGWGDHLNVPPITRLFSQSRSAAPRAHCLQCTTFPSWDTKWFARIYSSPTKCSMTSPNSSESEFLSLQLPELCVAWPAGSCQLPRESHKLPNCTPHLFRQLWDYHRDCYT